MQANLISFSSSWSGTWHLTVAIGQALFLVKDSRETIGLHAVSATRSCDCEKRDLPLISVLQQGLALSKVFMLLITFWKFLVSCGVILSPVFLFNFSGVAVYSVMISVLMFSSTIVKENEHFDVIIALNYATRMHGISACKASVLVFILLFSAGLVCCGKGCLVDCVDCMKTDVVMFRKGCRIRYNVCKYLQL